MNIEVADRGDGTGIVSFKSENRAEEFQLEYLKLKSKANGIEIMEFSDFADARYYGGLSIIVKLTEKARAGAA